MQLGWELGAQAPPEPLCMGTLSPSAWNSEFVPQTAREGLSG